MRKYTLCCLTLFVLCCTDNVEQNYPNVVIDYNVENLYDMARFEIYKNSSNKTCSCSGFLFKSADKNDTLNILSCDLNLDTIYQSADTTTMFFSFVNNSKEKINYINNLQNDCLQCIGIQFVGERLNKAYFSEDGYLLYNDLKLIHSKDSSFVANLKALHNSIDNNFLKKYVTQKNQ